MANPKQVIILLGYGGTEYWNNWRKKNKQKRLKIDFSGANLEDLEINFVAFIFVGFASFVKVNCFFAICLLFSFLSDDPQRPSQISFWLLLTIYINLRCFFRLFANLKNTKSNSRGLANANLANASFKNANLININFENAQLQKADFTNANLSNTLLRVVTALGTCFQGATLTGACIEDWHINPETDFKNVTCEYIYLKWDDTNNCPTERRPSNPNRNFAPGEFTKLFQISRETIDLFFREGIDWQAFLTSYQDIQCESEYGELDIRAIEKSSDGSFVIRVEVPENTNKAKLEAQFYERYESELKQLESFYQQQLRAKDTEIESYRRENANMTEIAKLLASRPITVEAKAVAEGNIQQSGNFGIGVNQGKVQEGAIVAGVYNEATKQDLQAAAKEIEALLDQLSEQYGDDEDILAAKIVKTAKKPDSNLHKLLLSLQAGSVSAIDSFLDHPAASFVISFLDTWHQNELKK